MRISLTWAAVVAALFSKGPTVLRRVVTALAVFTSVLAGSTGVRGQGAAAPTCDPGNGGLTLPAGFCAKVVADNLGAARNLVVAANGDVYISVRSGPRAPGQPPQPGFISALRDTDGDGTLDQTIAT